jgi:AcrR family transcriptional regulator
MVRATQDLTVDEETGCDAPGLATRRRDKAATKQALLEAAVAVFAERGFDGATTKEVAARAGVNEGLIQRYFAGTDPQGRDIGGKAGLLQAIVDGLCGEKLAACRLAPPSECLEKEIAGFLRAEVRQAEANRDFMRVILSRAMIDPALAGVLRRHYLESRLPLLVNRLRGFRDAGKLDGAIDLEALAGMLIAFAFGLGFMQQVVLAEDPERLDAVIASLAQVVLRGAGGGCSHN